MIEVDISGPGWSKANRDARLRTRLAEIRRKHRAAHRGVQKLVRDLKIKPYARRQGQARKGS
jgi:hypothetical protein